MVWKNTFIAIGATLLFVILFFFNIFVLQSRSYLQAEIERQEVVIKDLKQTVQNMKKIVVTKEKKFDALENIVERAREYQTSIELVLLVNQKAKKYDLDGDIVYSLIAKESRFEPRATNYNSNGTVDRGLMQLNSGTAFWLAEKGRVAIKDFRLSMLYEPETNLELGLWYLKQLHNKYKNWSAALTAYNRGPGGLEKHYVRTGSFDSNYSNAILLSYQE